MFHTQQKPDKILLKTFTNNQIPFACVYNQINFKYEIIPSDDESVSKKHWIQFYLRQVFKSRDSHIHEIAISIKTVVLIWIDFILSIIMQAIEPFFGSVHEMTTIIAQLIKWKSIQYGSYPHYLNWSSGFHIFTFVSLFYLHCQ